MEEILKMLKNFNNRVTFTNILILNEDGSGEVRWKERSVDAIIFEFNSIEELKKKLSE